MRKLPYGKSNFLDVIEDNCFYVDKTKYIETIENEHETFIFFLRPRRFGKSLFVSMLEYYYGIQYKDIFDKTYGNLYIGKHKTPLANSYLVLKFEFSRIDTRTPESAEVGFNNNVKRGINEFFSIYSNLFEKTDADKVLEYHSANEYIKELFSIYILKKITIPIYIIIDEYDHFANELLAFKPDKFKKIVSENGFVRKFYEAIKTATGQKIVRRMFATGVTPITLDSLTSGFNIAKNFSMRANMNNSMGFTQNELEKLLTEFAAEYGYELYLPKLLPDLKRWYNGYLFNAKAADRIYNPDMVLHFISEFSQNKFNEYPEKILDINIATDYAKLQKLFEIQYPARNLKIIDKIIEEGGHETSITQQFSYERDFSANDFISLLFYMGYLSIEKADFAVVKMQIPNYVIKTLFYDFFAEKIKADAQLEIETPDIYNIVKVLAQNNNIAPFMELIESVLKGLSNRDFIKFDEKYIHLLFIVFANQAGFYYVKSEPEINQKYPDVMFLWRPPFFPKYQFVFEIKYLKKSDTHLLDSKKKEAKEQLLGYLASPELKDFVVRSEGGMETVKAYTVVFVGEKAESVEELGIRNYYEPHRSDLFVENG